MSDSPADFAVFGSSPLARLLAGLLASTHNRKVLLIGESQSAFRLPRGIDLSVAPITRPETWAMLAEGIAETQRILSRIGARGALVRVDPIFLARNPIGIEALSHVEQMARGFRVAVEPVSPSVFSTPSHGIILRDALFLNRPALEAIADPWLDKVGIGRVVPEKVVIAADGSAQLFARSTEVSARQAILVDPDAIMAFLPLRQWPALFRRQSATAIVGMPGRPLPAALVQQIDNGLTLVRQAEGGIAAIGSGGLGDCVSALQGLLGDARPREQSGQTMFSTLATLDGAPAVGRAGGIGADVIAGLGIAGVFFAPALAKWLSGEAHPHQSRWFGARLVNRSAKSASVSEYAPAYQGQPA
jgi:hypothetical protein